MRSEFAAITLAFFNRLSQAEIAARRAAKTVLSASSEKVASAADHTVTPIEVLTDFRRWFLVDFIDPALQGARRPPVMRALFALNVFGIYIDIFSADDDVKDAVFTEDRINLLIACQASEFTEIRSRARSMWVFAGCCTLLLTN
jgi:hypothetical protein